MFSGNQKISCRQLYRGCTAGLISLSAWIMPLAMGRSGLPGILLSLALLGGLLYGTVHVPRPRHGWLSMLSYAHFWLIGTMAAHMSGLLVQAYLLEGMDLWTILACFYLCCYYNLYKGAECRSRVGEILFPFFAVLLLFPAVMMWGETEPGRYLELEFRMDPGQLKTGYQLFCWLSAAQGLWYLQGQTEPADGYRRAAGKVWATGAAAALACALFSYGIYGNAGHTGLVFPLASAMTLAYLPGDVVGRLDALFVFAWVTGLFLLCSTLLAPLRDGEPDRREKYLTFALLTASYAAALDPHCMEWGQEILYMISMPLQLLILLFSAWKGIGKGVGKGGPGARVRSVLLPVCLLPLWLTGCGGQELEDRSLVTAVGVDVGAEGAYRFTFGFGTAEEEPVEPFLTEENSLAAAKETYDEMFRKEMDFNHLKNIYVSRELLDAERFPELLEELQLDVTYSRGTSVYVTASEAGEEARQEEQPEGGTPLHRILNAWYNGERCRISCITEDHRFKGEISWPY